MSKVKQQQKEKKKKFLPPGFNTKALEKEAKNKWRWDWLTENDSKGEKWSAWLKKPDVMGIAFCEVCAKTINYKSNGKKALRHYAEDEAHKRNVRTVKTNQVVVARLDKEDKGTESMHDRIARQRTMTTAFLSEHCLPFSLAGDILDLAKRLAEDKTALDKTTLSPTSATYITTHGVAKSFKEEVKTKAKDKFVSLNMDEATNKNNDKVLNILIHYFDEETSQVVIDHLGSRIQNVATAAEIVKSVESVLQEYDIKWSQIVSVLMDNCSTMRGVKGGVEALVRAKNGCLLDISGDTVHMISNVAKTLMKNVAQGLQSICSDIYYDVEESPKVKELVCQVMTMMNAEKTKHILRPISSRFLQMHDVSTRILEVLDYLTIYYAAFLTDEEKARYSPLFDQIFKSHDVSKEAQAAITLLQFAQEKQQKSQTSHDRKDRILNALFINRTETIAMLNLCRGLLSIFQEYVKKFQTEAPQIHILHEQMVDITKTFMAIFIKPEHIPKHSVAALVKLDVSDRAIQKSDKDIAVGKYALPLITKARQDKSQHYWLDTLPLRNKTIRCLSVLDPYMQSHSQIQKAFKYLASLLPNVIREEETGCLDMELNAFCVDQQVTDLGDKYDGKRIDLGFWSPVRKLKTFDNPRYPVLSKLVCALLTSFSGPLIEGTFNVMGDIIEEDRSTMTIENYEAVAMIKTALKRKKVKSHQLKVTPSMKRCVINAYGTYRKQLSNKKEQAVKRKQEILDQSIQKLKIEKAKRLTKLIKLKNRISNKKTTGQKRKNPSTASTSGRQWKRIKTLP
ncbi:hypothetical protein ScPMuIL_005861 [Solemya velum]